MGWCAAWDLPDGVAPHVWLKLENDTANNSQIRDVIWWLKQHIAERSTPLRVLTMAIERML